MEAPSQVQPEELRPAEASKEAAPIEPWAAFGAEEKSPIADAFAKAKAQQPPPREAPAQREQQPQRQLGQKYQPTQTDLQRYGDEMIEIFKRADEKKRAKTELVAAQLKYSEACIAVEELRERTIAIFDKVNKSEHSDNSPQ